MKINIRLIYLYLFSFVGLLVVVIGAVRMVDLGMKVFVFKDADRYEYSAPEMKPKDEEVLRQNAERDQRRNREREFSNSLSMIVVGLPLYIYHWKTIQKENREK